MKPLAIDLFSGLGGWAEGLLAEGWEVVGFDIERHQYDTHRYPAQLVIQDVRTLHGSQFRDASLIVASPPCQFFSYCAMPWSRAKKLAAEVENDIGRLEKELALFKACFRIQREACEAAGRNIPLIVENVRGAQKWVGRARWNYGSFYLWGDVPALMPSAHGHKIGGGANVLGIGWTGFANTGLSWFAVAHNTTSGKGQNPDGRKGTPHRTAGHWANPAEHENGIKHPDTGHAWYRTGPGRLPSSSSRRKAASALIAKIPLPLSRHIAAVYRQGAA